MAEVTINGVKLNKQQTMTLYTAIGNFQLDLMDKCLGTDEKAKGTTKLYLSTLAEMQGVWHGVIKKIERMKAQKKIRTLPNIITEDVNANQVLAKAFDEVDEVVLAGHDHDGEFYFASSVADGGDILWFIEKLKHKLMTQL